MHSLVRWGALVAVLAFPLHRASADAKADAQVHIDKAGDLFASNKHREALDELKSAYALDPRPQLLYAIGQVHANLGQCADAKTFYQRFLTTKPPADVANVTREAIKACRDKPQVDVTPEVKPDVTPEVTPDVTPTPIEAASATPPWYTDYVGDALVGAGVISGVIGIIEYTSAKGDRDDAKQATTFQAFSDLIDSSNTKRTISIVCGVAGVALIGGGVARYLLHDRASDRRVEVVPTQGGAAVTFGGRF